MTFQHFKLYLHNFTCAYTKFGFTFNTKQLLLTTCRFLYKLPETQMPKLTSILLHTETLSSSYDIARILKQKKSPCKSWKKLRQLQAASTRAGMLTAEEELTPSTFSACLRRCRDPWLSSAQSPWQDHKDGPLKESPAQPEEDYRCHYQ